MDEKYLSVDEIASQYNVSHSTVRRWIQSGKLIGQKAGVQWRFSSTVVKEAFDKGMLSGGSNQLDSNSIIKYTRIPEWARPVLTKWSETLSKYLQEIQPDHIIVNDRRGTKIWELLNQFQYVWGKNLWHSTAISFMELKEFRKFFSRRKVLLFDEMMQHGKGMHDLRIIFEGVDAEVSSFVCVRRRSFFEQDALKEYKAFACEDLDDVKFNQRATLISRFVHLFEPPLDVDHFVVKSDLDPDVTIEQLLQSLSEFGSAFLIWTPDGDHDFFAITLDRPDFFDTSKTKFTKSFSITWDGPCKIRFYVNFNTRTCYCSFITYPSIEASIITWEKEAELPRKQGNISREEIKRIYNNICIDLAMDLFEDFVKTISKRNIGVLFGSSIHFDHNTLLATFGVKKGNAIAKRAKESISKSPLRQLSFTTQPTTHPPSAVRSVPHKIALSYDTFQCKTELLRQYTEPARVHHEDLPSNQLTYEQLFSNLPSFSEATIGRVLDYELDRGTIKPGITVLETEPQGNLKVVRSFSRGEYGVWFEWNRTVLPSNELAIQRTLGLGPVVVEKFLHRRELDNLSATQFNKLFTNLQHDWRENAHDLLYLGWRAYKYGPVPVVPNEDKIIQFDTFLKQIGCLDEETEHSTKGTLRRRNYKHPTRSTVPWRKLYKEKTSALTRTHVDGLIRIYSEIAKFKTTAARSPRTSSHGIFENPLVVLAAARNCETAYRCAWFELDDWRSQGKTLFPILESLTPVTPYPSAPIMKTYMANFAAPTRLLYDKIQMYRNLPYLRQQIVSLAERENYNLTEVILETVDPLPIFDTHSRYPMKNIEWACLVIRAFTSLVRQILTCVKLDAEGRRSGHRSAAQGIPKDAAFYLNELLVACPDLSPMRQSILAAIKESLDGKFFKEASNALSKTFNLILLIFDTGQKLPDPRLQFERDHANLRYRDGLLVRLKEVPIPFPYAIAVTDIRNLRHLPNISDIFGVTYADALENLLEWTSRAAKRVIQKNKQVALCGLPSDNIILAAPTADDIISACIELIRETSRCFEDIDKNQLAYFGLLKIGVSWHQPELGEGFGGYRSGVLAYEIGDTPGHPLGTIAITEALFERLSAEFKKQFTVSAKDGVNVQGNVYLRRWFPKRDLKNPSLRNRRPKWQTQQKKG